MTGHITLTAAQLRNVADFLTAMTEATKKTGVRLAWHLGGELTIDGDDTVGFSWLAPDSSDPNSGEYVIADRVGS